MPSSASGSFDPVVVVGGLSFWPRAYAGFAALLEDLSGSPVRIAPVTPLDWILGAVRGYGQLVFAVAETVDRLLLETGQKRAVLVGHSAGGLLCRAYIGGDPPFGGRRYSGHRRVSYSISLGTPHLSARDHALPPTRTINDLFPGALHAASGLRYLSVASASEDGRSSARVRRRYERFVADGRVPGDGVVPVEAALLPGSEHLILQSPRHDRRMGRWYGTDREAVEEWWPRELYRDARAVDASLVEGPGA
jgi:pimeloyl-ACP methyl ester carboxylesterase